MIVEWIIIAGYVKLINYLYVDPWRKGLGLETSSLFKVWGVCALPSVSLIRIGDFCSKKKYASSLAGLRVMRRRLSTTYAKEVSVSTSGIYPAG